MNHKLTRSMTAAGLGLSLTLALTLGSTRAQMQPLGAEAALTTMGTAFTYQGRLTSTGAPVNGLCDFQFGLWDAASGGAQIGITQTLTSVGVSAGYFTVSNLNFGSGAFNGRARWLATAVKCGSDPGYTALSPRQALTPAPHALALPGLWTQQNATSPNLIGGFHGNSVLTGTVGATIGGGGNNIFPNRVTDSYGTVGGGAANRAGDDAGTPGDRSYATVGGGAGNTASGLLATVSGGISNIASSETATVGGGAYNIASGITATVGGGAYNTASSQSATIGGGYSNTVSGFAATVGGGWGNTTTGSYATVAGGLENTTSNDRATVGGGWRNIASGAGATVGGGWHNTAGGEAATVGGGLNNYVGGIKATVSGGQYNTASGQSATVGGGLENAAIGEASTVGGGTSNAAIGIGATVGGGWDNIASGAAATVGGGYNNTAAGDYSFVAGRRAKNTNDAHDGVFIFADSTDADFTSTAPNQFLIRAARGVGINTNSPITNTLTVSGQVIAGGVNLPGGSEPFIAQGSVSGISMDDRAGGSNPRWVIYPNNGTLAFWASGFGNRVTISSTTGKLTAVGGFNGQCLSSGGFNSSSGNACNMDVAESFASVEPTEPGDLVVLEPNATDRPTVRKSARPYEDLLVGAVSTNPGLVFDNGKTYLAGDNSQLITADKTVVGLVGRVPVKVSMENGPIAIGDPLTSASQPGAAMKATRAGKIVGYAMQAADTDGKVLVLLQPGYYLPPDHLALREQNAEQQARIDALEARLAALERGAAPARGSMLDWSALGLALLGVAGGGAWLIRARAGGRR